MPTSSVVWCAPVSRSPDASTSRPSRPWRASSSSMWSRKPTPVETFASPPSRSSRRLTLVSLVSRLISAVRAIPLVLCSRLGRLRVQREALGAGQCSDHRRERPGRVLRDLDGRDAPPEDARTERALEATGTAGGQHVVRARRVVAEGRGAALADEHATGGRNSLRQQLGVLREDLEVFRSDRV